MAAKGKHSAESSSAFYRDLIIMVVGILLVGAAVYIFLTLFAGDDFGTSSTSQGRTAPPSTGPTSTPTTAGRVTTTRPQPTTTTSTTIPVRTPDQIRVVVLNSIGVNGAAGRLGELLSEAGYQVLEADDYEPTQDPSKIWFREGFSAEANEILPFLPGAEIEPLPDPSIGEGADIVLVLGVGYTE